ncbi:hypothetical protein, partial [Hymenobacter segetis]
PKLLLNYVDPFKGGKINPPLSVGVAGPVNSPIRAATPAPGRALNFPVAAPAVPVPPVVWPSLKYMGSINNTRQNTRIALLAIDEKEAMLKAGDERQGIVLTKIFRDSVLVVFQGKKKTIIRNLSPQ